MAARRQPPARRARRGAGTRANSRDRLPGWIWLLLGAAITLSVVTVVHLMRPRRPAPSPKSKAVAEANRPVAGPTKPVPVPPKQPPRFYFYEMLPSHETVIPRREAEKAVRANRGGKPLPAVLSAPGAYVVQVGAFRSRSEAERARAHIALLGVEAHTEQVTLSAGDIWYRVRIGPESNLAEAQTILDRLRGNGIKAILIKQKG